MHILLGLALGAIYILLAAGLTIVYGLLDVVNFAHGVFYMLGAYAVFLVISLTGSFWIGLASAAIITGLIGALAEVFLLRPLYEKHQLYPLLLTFGFSVAVPDLMKVIFGLIGKTVDYPEALSGFILLGTIPFPKYRLFIIVLTAVVMTSLWLFLKKSDLGMVMRAATLNSRMVEALGIDVARIWTVGFSIGVGLAALGGAVAAPMVSASPDMGVEITVESFVVVVLGGLGSLAGAVTGGLIIGQVVSFVSLFAGQYSKVAIFIVMFIVLLVRPRGLFGEAGRH
ncbi:amino acid/amide ABC transporter membrane protein 1, HAAT family [Desulfatibacillum alkenivorans DSM 16219]|jgi:branched-chain amino acid transport system permease protein|uniref:Amino acid/amide ABC transporter membrane protein 1, HAAT family n=1 Tax=Desulfatibacillum alkenivorans DSM 16219 TaxID=1121393 RepID=A0A1M6GFI2_9BACT|nr:branched-chain amino acid ABC transporter permease [Desulfatibacillum alkenivorans]SHJ08689.1 amino acid/amide ABC transporter membrane protein 1, HAAT family [Desulfatibacillum alkenivorans DSM 16219]